MQIPFRQGIVQCSHNFSNQPNFLKLLGGDVYVDTTIGPLLVSFSQGPSEYLIREQDNTQIQAFLGPFLGTLSYWFYWDLNVITGIKTYGYTNSFPVFGPVAPPSPVIDQHWFNTLTNGMFVWNGTNWVNKIRVFAGNLQNTQVTNEYALLGGNNVQKTFYVTGNITAEFVIGDAITIVGGGLNNGSYNVTAYIFNVGLNRSEITVSQIVPSPIITGFLQHVPTIGLTTGQLVAYDVGSQVGNNTAILSGFIFYDQNGVAVKLVNGQFFTTESPFISATGQTQPLKLEDSFTFGNVTQNMAAYQVVSVDSLDPTKLNPAIYEDTSTKVLGIILNNALIGQQALTVLQGVVDNPNWNWASPNITLWVNNGILVTIDPFVSDPINHPNKAPPVGRTINSTKIIFDQGLGGLGLQGLQGVPGNQVLASATQLGSVYLTLNPAIPATPLAVGDNDPRMSDPRTPLPHNQAATTITVTPVAPVIPLPTDVQDAFVSVVTALVAKVNRAGDSMTGSLVFPTTVGITVTGLPNPLLASDAVPLGFLVSSLSSYLPLSGGTMTGAINMGAFKIINAGNPTLPQDLATKFYVDSILATNTAITTAINANASPIIKCAPVYVSSADNVDLARANILATTKAVGLVADATIASAATGNISGEVFFTATTAEWDAVTGQVGGLTAGATYYISDAIAGRLTTVAPVTVGNFVAVIGIAMSTTKMRMTINPVIQL